MTASIADPWANTHVQSKLIDCQNSSVADVQIWFKGFYFGSLPIALSSFVFQDKPW
jgi:hypothetical protein